MWQDALWIEGGSCNPAEMTCSTCIRHRRACLTEGGPNMLKSLSAPIVISCYIKSSSHVKSGLEMPATYKDLLRVA